jgi:hypothetical protein
MTAMLRPLALAALLAALPRLALAEPAVVRLFEAPARAAPSKEAPVVHTFTEGQQVSVSETSTDGFRKVRLPDGGVGFVEEAALTVGASPRAFPPNAAPPVPTTGAPAGLPAAAPDLRARIYVKDLDHLAELVKGDAQVAPLAEKMVTQKQTAWAVGGAGLVAGAVMIAIGVSQLNSDFNRSMNDPGAGSPSQRGAGVVVGGSAVIGLAAIATYAIMPKRDDLLDVVNTWNQRHPDQQFDISSGPRHFEMSSEVSR